MGQLSPDGHWRWDGWRWVPAVPLVGQPSPDGQWRWDGQRWVPVGVVAARPRPAPRVPTLWTRRLQLLLLVVAGLQVVSTLTSAALLPFEWGRLEAVLVAQWQTEGIPATEISTLEQSMRSVLWVSVVLVALFALGFCALQVVGTLRRWVWWYWVQFALFCLATVGLLLTPLDFASPVFRAEMTAVTLPLSIAVNVLEVAAGVCMLIAAIRIGPWAMTRDPGFLGAPARRP